MYNNNIFTKLLEEIQHLSFVKENWSSICLSYNGCKPADSEEWDYNITIIHDCNLINIAIGEGVFIECDNFNHFRHGYEVHEYNDIYTIGTIISNILEEM